MTRGGGERTSLASLGIGRVSPSNVKTGADRPVLVASGCTSHMVVSTDTLEGLAMRYGSTVAEIKKLNGLWSSRDIYTRRQLIVPDREFNSLEERNEERRLKVEMFCQTTGALELKAQSMLTKANWLLDRAVEDFFAAAEKERIAAEALSATGAKARGDLAKSADSSYSSMEEEPAQPSAFYDAVRVGSAKQDMMVEHFEGEL